MFLQTGLLPMPRPDHDYIIHDHALSIIRRTCKRVRGIIESELERWPVDLTQQQLTIIAEQTENFITEAVHKAWAEQSEAV